MHLLAVQETKHTRILDEVIIKGQRSAMRLLHPDAIALHQYFHQVFTLAQFSNFRLLALTKSLHPFIEQFFFGGIDLIHRPL